MARRLSFTPRQGRLIGEQVRLDHPPGRHPAVFVGDRIKYRYGQDGEAFATGYHDDLVGTIKMFTSVFGSTIPQHWHAPTWAATTEAAFVAAGTGFGAGDWPRTPAVFYRIPFLQRFK